MFERWTGAFYSVVRNEQASFSETSTFPSRGGVNNGIDVAEARGMGPHPITTFGDQNRGEKHNTASINSLIPHNKVECSRRPVRTTKPPYQSQAISTIYPHLEKYQPETQNLERMLSTTAQDHYDYGLRNLKAVLNMAGALKRADPNMNEEAILMRALR